MIYFNQRSGELMNDQLDFVKQVHCPKKVSKDDLVSTTQQNFLCTQCEKTIHNLDVLDENEITQLLKKDPKVCVNFSSNHPNIKTL